MGGEAEECSRCTLRKCSVYLAPGRASQRVASCHTSQTDMQPISIFTQQMHVSPSLPRSLSLPLSLSHPLALSDSERLCLRQPSHSQPPSKKPQFPHSPPFAFPLIVTSALSPGFVSLLRTLPLEKHWKRTAKGKKKNNEVTLAFSV